VRRLHSRISLWLAGLLLALPLYAQEPAPELSHTVTAIDPVVSAPEFTLNDMDGEPHRLADYRGKVVLINFWATWCPPCRAEMPSMEALNQAMAGDDFVMLAINVEQDGRSSVPAFLEKSPHTFSVLYDDQGVVQTLYGVYKFPESFVIRKDGIIDDRVIGAIDWVHPETVAYFKELAKG
jgi:peroxiredoxin